MENESNIDILTKDSILAFIRFLDMAAISAFGVTNVWHQWVISRYIGSRQENEQYIDFILEQCVKFCYVSVTISVS